MEGRDERGKIVKNRKKTLRKGIGELKEEDCNTKNWTCN